MSEVPLYTFLPSHETKSTYLKRHLPDIGVEPEQWLQRHPEAGSSWASWPEASHRRKKGYVNHEVTNFFTEEILALYCQTTGNVSAHTRRIVLLTVPRGGRSYKLFSDGFELRTSYTVLPSDKRRPTGVPQLQGNAPPKDPTVGLCPRVLGGS